MQQISAKRNWRTRLSLFVVLAYLVGLVSPAMLFAGPVVAQPLAPQDTVIAEYDFEDGEQGWWPFGSTTVAATTETAHSGSQSLKVTNRTQNWQGAGTNVLSLLQVGATYTISGCTRLVAGQEVTETQTIITMKQTVDGTDSYFPFAPTGETEVTADGWACAQGTYEYTAEATELTLYVQSASATASFYIDDVTIVMTSPPPVGPAEVIALYDFDDDTTQGWVARTDTVTTTIEVVSEAFRSEPNSLKVTGRSEPWHGASVNVTTLLEPGVTYEISGCVRMVEGEPASQLIISMQRTFDGDTSWHRIVPSAEEEVTDAAWTCLQGSYIFAEADELILYVETEEVDQQNEFYIDDVTILSPAKPPIQTDIPSVYEFHEGQFRIGAAIEPHQLDSPRHVELLTKHFNNITAENVMKPGSLQPEEGDFNWGPADKLADFARDNDIAIHGHTLVWHSQAADWMFEDAEGEPLEATPENKELVLERMEDHIRAVVERYDDVVTVWDVVNEVIDPNQDDCLRRSEWYRLTGSDYISVAFTIAREVATDAKLILNDYGETQPAKRACMYQVVKDLQDQGVPVDGVGMQMHINIQNPSVAAIEETIEMFAELGEVYVTELDMSIYTNDYDSYNPVPEEVLIKQGYRYKEIFEAFRRQADNLALVTFWGMADDHTWLSTWPTTRINLPLLFDEDLQAKWAYWGVIYPSQLPIFIQEQFVSMASPVVDGMTETLWEMLPWIEIGSTGTMTASFQTRWDVNNLYVIVKVEDHNPDPGDKVEVFVDQNNGKTEFYEDDDRYYAFPSETFWMDYVIITNTHGYVLEARLPLSETLEVGKAIGFDVRVTDGSDASVLSWNDLSHSQETDTSKFGTLILIEETKLTTAIRGTPVIDGHADAIWANATEIETDVWVEGVGGATAKVRTMWDETHLYVYAVVSDSLLSDASSNPWEQDSIEVFIDQNNAKTTNYEPDDGQYRVNFNNVQSFGGAASAETLTSETFIIPADQTLLMEGAYIVELAITLTHVIPEPGVFIGFDFQVNDDANGDGVRNSVAIWNDPTGQSWQNTSRLGVLQFVEQPSRLIYLPLVMRAYAP